MNSAILNDAIRVLKDAKDKGTKIVGIVQHSMFPDELVLAAGAIPVRLILGGKDEQEIGDHYLSATTCPFGRATLGFFEKSHPLYSFFDTLIVGTFCNGVQNVANYLHYFEIPSVSLVLPHDRRESSLNFYVNELKKIQTYLENLTGKRCTAKGFSDAIQSYNEMRSLLRKINEYRKQDIPPISGTGIHELVCQSLLVGPKVMIPKCQEVLDTLNDSLPQYSGTRILLTGSGITFGDIILEIIEDQCGGLIVADDLWSSMDYFLEDVEITNPNPLKSLADRYLCRNLCGRMIPESEIRIPKIVELYRSYHAKGIINHTLKFCDSYSSLKPEFRKFMARRDISVLDLDRDYAESDVGQLKTRIEAFLEMIA
ncbi:MAG: 2-hydroxyacyl-CoA dehydratase subunit D [Promethearchaeota archaeon]